MYSYLLPLRNRYTHLKSRFLRPHPAVFILFLAIGVYAGGFSYLTLIRYAAFEARALDMGNLNQAIWNTAHGNWFHLTNQPGTVNRLSLHVEPIILPIAALYRLYMAVLPPGAQTAGGPLFLVVLQSVVVALGAWPVFALARRVLAHAWLGLVFGVAFLLNPSIQAANWLEFHPVTLAPTFLMAAFYFLMVGRMGWFAFFAVLAASCKEEIGLLIFMQGFYAFLFLGGVWDAVWQRVAARFGISLSTPGDPVGPARSVPTHFAPVSPAGMRRVGLITMALALGWSLTAVLGIQNLFAHGNIHWGRYDYLGASPLEMVWSLLSRPQLVWAQLHSADALGYVHQLFAPVGYLPVLAPHVFLLALPSLGINLLADFPPMHQVTTLIYAAPIMPFAMLSAILGAARLRTWWRAGLQADRPGRWARLDAARRPAGLLAVWILGAWVLGAALIQHRAHGYLPTGGNYRLYTVTEHHRRAANIMARIPPDATVSAQDKLNPHVSGRETVYIFPRINGIELNSAERAEVENVADSEQYPPADMIWVDVTGPAWPQHPSDLHTTVQELLAGPYGILAGDDGYLLLARHAEGQTPPPEFYTAWQLDDAAPTQFVATEFAPTEFSPIEFGDRLRLLDYAVTTDAHGELVVQFDWQATTPIEEPLGFYVAYRDRAGHTLYDTEFYPPVAQLWYPTEMWSPGATVRVQTLPWMLESGPFGLYLGVYRQDDAQDEAGAPSHTFLPITQSMARPENALPLVDGETRVRLGGFEPVAPTGWQAVVGGQPREWQPLATERATGTGSPARPVDAVFGVPVNGEIQGRIALRGVDVAQPEGDIDASTGTSTGESTGQSLAVTLYWETLAPVAEDYTVFVHVLDGQDTRLAQLDDGPRDAVGPRPMTGWRAGETLIDRRLFDLLPQAEADAWPGQNGELRLHIGVYHWSDGARLPVTGGDARPGDFVEIVFEPED